ncbi:hypothetical protein L3V86_09255 [Thiotrichales bacterium 19S11-10]|nr:hypothetical protein [Thiotrichales bacterium 19S11-10]
MNVVCFDSNIYEYLVNSEKINNQFTDEKISKDLKEQTSSIISLIDKHKILPCISEQTLTDELIPKKHRESRILNYQPCYIKSQNYQERSDGNSISIKMGFGMQQNKDILPSFNDNTIAKNLFKIATEKFGFKVLYSPHYLYGRSNHDISIEYFLEPDNYNELQTKAHYGLGIIKNILIDLYNNHEIYEKDISENCDRDAIASCYAYGIKYFCTLDQGKNTGETSVMHDSNKLNIEEEMDIKIVSPQELLKIYCDKYSVK